MIENCTSKETTKQIGVTTRKNLPVTITLKKLSPEEIDKFFYEDFLKHCNHTPENMVKIFLNLFRIEEFWRKIMDSEELEKIGQVSETTLRDVYSEFARLNPQFEMKKAAFIGIAMLSQENGVLLAEPGSQFVLS